MLLDKGLSVSIRETIQKELNRRGWSRYRLIKELKGAIPANTVYDYLRGETDIGSESVSIILQALGLQIKSKFRRGKQTRKEV
jgi:hypothetical protein